MKILVCVKRVPDTSDNEIELQGDDIRRDDLVYSVNEWDNYAVEEALRITESLEGQVTVVTVGGDDDEEVLRRQMAMGAKEGALLSAGDGLGGAEVAAVLAAYAKKGNFDLILTGVQAEDGCAQVGGMLAALLDWPFASLVNAIEVMDGKLKVWREVEGGDKEINEIDLPCVLSIQTGINEPRYVGMRGIRQVASVPIPKLGKKELGMSADAAGKVRREGYFVPAQGKGAEMLQGSAEEMADKVMDLMRAKGGLK